MSDIAALEVPIDRRVRRTQEALRGAFRDLFFAHGFDDFSIADIAAHADVGRSTFYKHFASKDDILADCMGPFLAVMADACVSAQQPPNLVRVFAHFWENRHRARRTLCGSSLVALTRLLAGQIETRLPRLVPAGCSPATPAAMVAASLAAGQFTLLDQWLRGRGSCSAADLSRALHRGAYAGACAMMRDG